MVVIILESVPTSVRGELTRWMLELKAGVFIGNLSALVRDMLWKMVCSKMRDGAGMLIYNAANEQGLSIRFSGNTSRRVEDFEGLLLIRHPQTPKTTGE
ncbi:MAG: type I-E CRISPR-associated endoribonuclease Cas2 [Acidobacteria bacterium]|nr:type I-E CRISPR-associated endoribonuclease Cas2 [Acidobacteriota bacterium]